MKRSMFALAGVAVLAAVTALIFGVLAKGGVPATAAAESFTFCSGSASASFDPNTGEGPTTSGLGAFGADDPVTSHDGVGVLSIPPGPAVIIDQYPGWGLIPGSRWISYDATQTGLPNFNVVTFKVNFVLPAGARNPVLTVTSLQDDRVEIFLNGVAGTPPSQGGPVTPDETTFPPPLIGSNELRFDLEQVGAVAFGLDYCATVTPLGPVGGITELLIGGSDSPASVADGSGSTVGLYAAIAGAAALVVALLASGWYARRRLLR